MNHRPCENKGKSDLVHKVLPEIFLAARFALVGILATTIHITILWALLSTAMVPIFIANTIAFACAFGFSFLGNYHWTFGAPGSPKTALFRFFTISGGAFLLNSALLGLLLELAWFDPLILAIGSAAVIPCVTFLASRFWGFNTQKTAQISTNAEAKRVSKL